MIRTFAHKGLARFHRTGSKAGIQPMHANRLRMILALLEAATVPEDMNFPGSRLHILRGTLANHWSVSVQGPWRLTFRIEGGNAYEVDYVQYH